MSEFERERSTAASRSVRPSPAIHRAGTHRLTYWGASAPCRHAHDSVTTYGRRVDGRSHGASRRRSSTTTCRPQKAQISRCILSFSLSGRAMGPNHSLCARTRSDRLRFVVPRTSVRGLACNRRQTRFCYYCSWRCCAHLHGHLHASHAQPSPVNPSRKSSRRSAIETLLMTKSIFSRAGARTCWRDGAAPLKRHQQRVNRSARATHPSPPHLLLLASWRVRTPWRPTDASPRFQTFIEKRASP